MQRKITLALAAAVAGCAAEPPQPADDSPQNPTAVFETVVSSTGIAGMFPFEATEKRYVRANMRREDHATRGTGQFSAFLVNRFSGPGTSSIARVDRKVQWWVNHGSREYAECPIQGCPTPAGAKEKPKPEAQREEPKQKAEEGCVMRIASSRFDVKPTNQKREVNGFNAEQYQGAWVLRLQDKQKRTTTSTVKLDIWTAPVNAQMRQALETEAAFLRSLAANAPRTARTAAAERPVIAPELVSAMTGYLGSLSAADRAALAKAAREFDKIKGHAVSTTIEWLLEGNACAAKDEQAAQPTSGAGMLSALGGMFGKKEEGGGAAKPLFSITVDVKQLGVQPVRDSTFTVPPSYKLRKVP
jgi:hypothetical protein